MPTKNSPRKKLLDAALKTLLVTLDVPKWLKAPATLVAELSGRFGNLPEQERAAVRDASDRDFAEVLLQLDLATGNSAHAAAGTVRIEEQVAALRAAIERSSAPTIIKFPGMPNTTQTVTGDGNITVSAGGDVNIRMPGRSRKGASPHVAGTVCDDARKIGYLQYLVRRYQQFKEWEVGKENMRYALIHTAYQRTMKYTVKTTPFDQFGEGAAFLQGRIEKTRLGRTLRSRGRATFSTFDTFDVAGDMTLPADADE